MAERTVLVVNALGLHARAAARFVRSASKFQSSVTVIKDGTSVDGKSILGILFLAAGARSTITIRAEGTDSSEAVETLCELVSSGLGEPIAESVKGRPT